VGEIIDRDLRPMLGSLGEGAPEIVGQLESFTQSLNETLAHLDGFLTGENAKRIQRILGNLDSGAASLASVSGDLEQTRRRMDELLESVNALVEENRRPLDQSVADLQQSLESVSRHIEAIAHHLEVTTRNMNEFSRQIRENPGVIIRGRTSGDGAN
jgi:phospholipid/cholesterol/gamma-HCH transport system substrate-binding protein